MSSRFHAELINSPFGDPGLYVRFPHRGQAVLFDCGELHALCPRDLLKIRVVFISHAHIDHVIGLDHLVRVFLPQDKLLCLCGPPDFIAQMHHRLGGYTWNLTRDYPLRLRLLEWGEEEFKETFLSAKESFSPSPVRRIPAGPILYEDEHIRVRAEALAHRDIPSLAFRLEEPVRLGIDKQALREEGLEPGPWLSRLKESLLGPVPPDELLVRRSDGTSASCPLPWLERRLVLRQEGTRLCYVTDASPCENNHRKILELARDVDLLAIEATFPHQELERARARHHLTAHLSGHWAKEAGARRLLLFHHSGKYAHTPQLLEQEAVCAFKK